jgi:hypothetical protein
MDLFVTAVIYKCNIFIELATVINGITLSFFVIGSVENKLVCLRVKHILTRVQYWRIRSGAYPCLCYNFRNALKFAPLDRVSHWSV